jgi:HEAT repeat protein
MALGEETAVQALLDVCDEHKPRFNYHAVALLEKLKSRASVPFFLQVLEAGVDGKKSDEVVSPQILRSAVEVLSKLRVDDATELMIEFLPHFDDPPLRRSLVNALWRLRAVEAIPVLESLKPIPRQERLNKLVTDTIDKLKKERDKHQ